MNTSLPSGNMSQPAIKTHFLNYEKYIVRFSGTPFEVSYTGENIVAVTIGDKHEVVFVNVITNTIFLLHTRSSLRSMLIRSEYGLFSPSLWVKICL
jgi:hypothetical protein